jgi:hypothetical protein
MGADPNPVLAARRDALAAPLLQHRVDLPAPEKDRQDHNRYTEIEYLCRSIATVGRETKPSLDKIH